MMRSRYLCPFCNSWLPGYSVKNAAGEVVPAVMHAPDCIMIVEANIEEDKDARL